MTETISKFSIDYLGLWLQHYGEIHSQAADPKRVGCFLVSRSIRRDCFRAPQFLSGKSEQQVDKFIAESLMELH
jgi:hypothetical protein